MDKKTFSLGEYIKWILKKFQEIQTEAQSNEKFRILEIIHVPNNFCKLKIQIIGMDKILHWSPHEIITDNHLLEGFSKKDIMTITYYACEELKKPKYKIISHSFSEKINKIIFRMKKFGSNNKFEKTAAEISLNKDMINEMNSNDAHRVGYLCAMEEAEKEKIMLKECERLN